MARHALPLLPLDQVLSQARRRWRRHQLLSTLWLAGIVLALLYAGVLDPARYQDVLRPIVSLTRDALPPDFSRWMHWGRPLLETLSMSVAGTVLGLGLAIPLGALAARTLGPRWLSLPILLGLNALRSIPGLVWGVIFVAALGFGPLPGVMALSCHSTGMLGKFCAEILEHLDPAPGDALRSQGSARWGSSALPSGRSCCPGCWTPPCTAGNTICAPPPRWAWWVQVGWGWKSSRRSICSSTAKHQR